MSLPDLDSIPLGKYLHYKGKLYDLIYIAHHSETREAMAVYRALYGEYGMWVRPLSMFLEMIEIDGKTRQRFQYVGETPVTPD